MAALAAKKFCACHRQLYICPAYEGYTLPCMPRLSLRAEAPIVTPRGSSPFCLFLFVSDFLFPFCLAGYLAANGMWRWSFFLCGSLKIIYDVALLVSARHMKPDTEQSPGPPSP